MIRKILDILNDKQELQKVFSCGLQDTHFSILLNIPEAAFASSDLIVLHLDSLRLGEY